MSTISSTSTKMNCYTDYIVQILMYCSQAWLPNRINMYKIEKVQIMATKWILGNSLQSYKERLISLKLLPLFPRSRKSSRTVETSRSSVLFPRRKMLEAFKGKIQNEKKRPSESHKICVFSLKDLKSVLKLCSWKQATQ